ncbi:3-phosphoinositide-dependent protein kinase 1 [Nymphaea thermarum]|nr:3-phosphoinositide-dependent protein kinase 1 [Nymphaea thermarum]
MSSTGVYLDNDDDNDEYMEYSNSSLLSMPDSELYKSARIAATSLKYYGLCLYDGNYTVKLHFAEIMITDEKNFSSLGRRLFDVYIQGKLMLHDFNIKENANGSFKDVTKVFPNITVTSGSLRIHLFWAGKGTTVIPKKGVYGPLISAIKVTAEFEIPEPPVDRTVLVIVVVVASAAVLIILLLAVLYARHRANHGKRDGPKLDWNTRRRICIGVAKGLAHLHGGTRLNIVHRDIKPTNILLDKDLNAKISDFGMAKLVEADHRSRTPEVEEKNDCSTQHDGDEISVSSTQLDEDGSDEDGIESSTAVPDEVEHSYNQRTRIVGTEGYIAPEYKKNGRLSCKADVYSFGIVVLEVVSGKIHRSRHSENCLPLLDWALVLQKNGRLLELVDPELGTDFSEEEAYVLLDVALRCTDKSSSKRPDMCTVVGMMESETPMKPQPVSSKEKKTVPSEVEIEYSQSQYSWVRDESQDGPWTASMSGTSTNYNDSGVNPPMPEDSHPVDVESGRRRRRHTKNQRTESVEHPASWSSCYSCGTKK